MQGILYTKRHLEAAEGVPVVLHLQAELRQEEVPHPVPRHLRLPEPPFATAQHHQRLRADGVSARE